MMVSYWRRHQEHGFTSRALYYSRDSLHRDRLQQAKRILSGRVSPEESFLDVGCGYGEMAPFIPPEQYYGVDVLACFVEEAQTRHPGFEFTCCNVLDLEKTFDWVGMIGIMGTLPKPEEVLKKSSELCARGILVDFIDAQKYQGPLNHFDIGICTDYLLALGFKQVHVYGTPDHPWTFLLAEKQCLFNSE